MKKYLLIGSVLIAGISIFFIVSSQSQSKTDTDKNLTNQNENIIVKKDFGKVLVVYYSLSGNTADIANKIKKKTNADIYKIETVKEYPSSPMIYITAKKQINPKNYPELKSQLPDFSQYDLIFIGSPVWWYTISSPVLSFLAQADFKGKRVIPFATHGGDYGTFFEDFEQKIKNAKVLKGIEFKKVSKENGNIINNRISNWLNNLEN